MKAKACIKRRVPGQMSTTEAKFREHLQERVERDEIFSFAFEPVRLKLADLTYYTPDFMLIHNDGLIEFVEVKGSWHAPNQDKSRVKLKVAAEQNQWAKFSAAVPIAKKNGGGWEIEEIGPHKVET